MPAAPDLSLNQVLANAQAAGLAPSNRLDRLDAQLLLLHALGKAPSDRAWLVAHGDDGVPHAVLSAFSATCQRRAQGEPLAYITGHKAFYGLDLQVNPHVLVPRPDTETLVDWALELLPTHGTAVDLGTGSGAVALALKSQRPFAQVQGTDFSADALAMAKRNASRLQLQVPFSQGSWFDAVRGRFDLIVSNPPYIADGDAHLSALVHEPLQALTSGADGLDDIRLIASRAPLHLQPGGWLLLEHGFDQAAKVRQLLLQAGFGKVQSRLDLNGVERCSGGQCGSLEKV